MTQGRAAQAALALLVDKRCKDCGEVKLLSSFHRYSKARDGRRPTCTPCRNIQIAKMASRHANVAAAAPSKICGKCRRSLPLTAYWKQPQNRDGRWSKCSECVNGERGVGTENYRTAQRAKYRAGHRKWAGTIIAQARGRAKRDGVPMTITWRDLLPIPTVCPVLGVPIFMADRGFSPNSPTLDRVDPRKGYVAGNIAVISWLANKTKGNVTDPEVFDAIARYIRRMT